MQNYVRVYSGSLNQTPISWNNNLKNVLESIQYAVSNECDYRPGIEFELCGVFCGIHFHDENFTDSVWKSVQAIMKSGLTEKLPVEIGSVLKYRGLLYNCLVMIYKSKVLFIRPSNKIRSRPDHPSNQFISEWTQKTKIEYIDQPDYISELNVGHKIPIGNFAVDFNRFSVVSIFDCEFNSEIFQKALVSRPTFISLSQSRAFEAGRQRAFLNEVIQESNDQTVIINTITGVESPKTVFEGGSYLIRNGKIHQMTEGLSLSANLHSSVLIKADDYAPRKPFSNFWKLIKVDFAIEEKNLDEVPEYTEYKFESDDEIWECSLGSILNNPNWTQQLVNYTSFTKSGGGVGTLNLNRIYAWRLVFENSTSSSITETVWIDDLRQITSYDITTNNGALLNGSFIQLWNTNGCACGQWTQSQWTVMDDMTTTQQK